MYCIGGIPNMYSIHIYSRSLHDNRLPIHVQSMCVKMLLGIVESVCLITSKLDVRYLLMRALDAFSQRLSALRIMFPSVADYKAREVDEYAPVLGQSMDGFLDLGQVQPILTSSKVLDGTGDALRELRSQFRTILFGVKNILFSLKQMNLTQADPTARPYIVTTFIEEVDIIVGIFKHGIMFLEHPNPNTFRTGLL